MMERVLTQMASRSPSASVSRRSSSSDDGSALKPRAIGKLVRQCTCAHPTDPWACAIPWRLQRAVPVRLTCTVSMCGWGACSPLVLRVPHLLVWVGVGFVRDWCLGGCLPQPAAGRIVPEFLIKPVDGNPRVCLLSKEVKRVMLQNQHFLVRLRVESCADPEKMDRAEFKAFAEVL